MLSLTGSMRDPGSPRSTRVLALSLSEAALRAGWSLAEFDRLASRTMSHELDDLSPWDDCASPSVEWIGALSEDAGASMEDLRAHLGEAASLDSPFLIPRHVSSTLSISGERSTPLALWVDFILMDLADEAQASAISSFYLGRLRDHLLADHPEHFAFEFPMGIDENPEALGWARQALLAHQERRALIEAGSFVSARSPRRGL